MTICGVGIDLCEIKRVERSLERYGKRFCQRILLPSEMTVWEARRNSATFLAGRFAIKEACFKALGAPKSILFRHVETVVLGGGKPSVRFYDVAEICAKQLGMTRIHVSLSHDAGVAAAVAILES